MKCRITYSRKNKENIVSLSSAEFVHSMVNVNSINLGKSRSSYIYLFDLTQQTPFREQSYL